MHVFEVDTCRWLYIPFPEIQNSSISVQHRESIFGHRGLSIDAEYIYGSSGAGQVALIYGKLCMKDIVMIKHPCVPQPSTYQNNIHDMWLNSKLKKSRTKNLTT
eukprot:gb/GECH01006649.1/.p1 GENE.gb/GECH01006649.1/~~gb/GECH01006649.1/.p1  ORF type:complete len:104 (+),score=22.14 gb/GECH01006649.1/:1-312(+)